MWLTASLSDRCLNVIPYSNLLPTAKLLARMNIECRERGHAEPFVGDRQDELRLAHSDSTVVYPTSLKMLISRKAAENAEFLLSPAIPAALRDLFGKTSNAINAVIISESKNSDRRSRSFSLKLVPRHLTSGLIKTATGL